MKKHSLSTNVKLLIAGIAVAACTIGTYAHAQDKDMTFFITSKGPGNGGDLGGLDGADAHCAALASAAGSELTEWAAYLSVQGGFDRSSGTLKIIPGVNARDRIGSGPWHNANGTLIANDIDDLHSADNPLNKGTGLDENGKEVNGRGEKPNRHDILTGSDPLGMYSTAGGDTSCGGWTSSSEGSAIVGHHDRTGPSEDRHMVSWNSSHGSAGCAQENLQATGGDGLFYCFYAKK